LYVSAFWDICITGWVHIHVPNRDIWDGILSDGFMIHACVRIVFASKTGKQLLFADANDVLILSTPVLIHASFIITVIESEH